MGKIYGQFFVLNDDILTPTSLCRGGCRVKDYGKLLST